jgi:hypothetical protein
MAGGGLAKVALPGVTAVTATVSNLLTLDL